jgi:factor associated with neutral sphingomyelinase activation
VLTVELLLCSYKQRGEQAEAADNVFHHLTYEGAADDIDALPNPQERAALEAQV